MNGEPHPLVRAIKPVLDAVGADTRADRLSRSRPTSRSSGTAT